MLANRYTNQQNDLSQREQHMRDGTLFDAYQYRLSTYASGAQKMALRSFNGMLSIIFASTASRGVLFQRNTRVWVTSASK